MRDFYERQANARSETFYLVVLLVAAISGLVVTAAALVSNLIFLVRYGMGEVNPPVLDPWIMLVTAMVTLGIIAFGAIWKAQELQAGGGVALAASLQARLVVESGQLSSSERKLLNVVQEVALAAGIPAPHVCVLDHDRAINAFAAGFTQRDAVLGVTRGCMEKLTRDQLQGVVAHEFSHILNGDMLLNMRALIILHGVFGIDTLGRWLLIVSKQQWVEAELTDQHFVGQMVASVALAILGTGLIVLGSLGTLCGLIISAAMSRQREYLADASAVELTRNPHGIADALKRIGGFPLGTRMRSVLANEVNHMCFCPATRQFAKWLSSHPPLPDRIQRLDPEWDGTPHFEQAECLDAVPEALQGALQLVSNGAREESAEVDQDRPANSFPASSISENYLRAVDRETPVVLHELSTSMPGCAILLAALVWEEKFSELLWGRVRAAGQQMETALRTIWPVVSQLPSEQKLRLFDLAYEHWTSQTVVDRQPTADLLHDLLRQSEPGDWFHWGIRKHLRLALARGLKPPVARYANYGEVAQACRVLLSALVYAGHEVGPTAEYAFRRAAVHFDGVEMYLLETEECGHAELSQAVEQLGLLSPSAQRSLLLAVSRCISADHAIEADEAALVRGLCAGMRVAVPRLMPGQPVIGQ